MAVICWESAFTIIQNLAKSFDSEWRERERKIGTTFLIIFLMRLCFSRSSSGYQIIIQEIWDSMKNFGIDPPQDKPFSQSAVCEARGKLNAKIIKEINVELVDSFLSLNDDKYRWKDKRLFVVDGSTIHLPPELKKEGFGRMNPNQHYPQGKISALLHVGSKIAVDVILDHKGNERELALEHLKVLIPEDVVIYDRGYFSYIFTFVHILSGVDAIMRLPISGNSKEIQDFIDDNSKPLEKLIKLSCPKNSNSEMYKKYKNSDLKPIDLKLIRYTINGEEYIIATTLLEDHLKSDDFSEIYDDRWQIEEHYKILKVLIGIESFHAKSRNGVLQEIYTAELLSTISQILAAESKTLLETNDSESKKKRQIMSYVSKIFAQMKGRVPSIRRKKMIMMKKIKSKVQNVHQL